MSKVPRTIEPEEFAAILDVIDLRHPTQVRNHAMLRLLYDAGLRVSEACHVRLDGLRWRDQGTGRGEVCVPDEDGCKTRDRVVPFKSLELAASIERWLAFRESIAGGSPLLFVSLSGEMVDPFSLRRALARYATKAGLSQKVTPHMLRHTYATQKLRRPGYELVDVAMLLGHKSTAPTARYLHSSHRRLDELTDAE